MNQLKTYTFNGAYNVNYAQNGNINSKSDAGTYSYDNTKINAVTGITGNPGTIPTSANQSITYTPFNMASTVAEYEGENERKKVEFTYGPDNQRIKSVLRLNGAEVKKKYYSAEYEKEITATTDRDIHYIYCPYGLVAVIVKQNSTETTYFTETDHLGSILGLMDSNGIYIERSSLDAWGRRRNPTDWTYYNIPVSTITDRGYTGHEHLDMFGLINMNGRMYDPVLGRFAGVDPIIQSPDNSLSYNGYAYCLNNPLKYSDPTGFAYYYDPWTQQDGKYHSLEELMWASNPDQLNDIYYQNELNNFNRSGSVNDPTLEKIEFKTVYISINGSLVPIQVPVNIPAKLMANSDKNYKLTLNVSAKFTIGVQAGGNIGGLGGNLGIFGNLFSVTLFGYDTKSSKLYYPGSQNGYSQINQSISGGFYVGGGYFTTFDGSFSGYGFRNSQTEFYGTIGNRNGTIGMNFPVDSDGFKNPEVRIPISLGAIIGFEICFTINAVKR